jgi:hypothetical protein
MQALPLYHCPQDIQDLILHLTLQVVLLHQSHLISTAWITPFEMEPKLPHGLIAVSNVPSSEILQQDILSSGVYKSLWQGGIPPDPT